uniref:CUT domain-containing protein n=1 Tax=Rhabditophanes sp. KR3021 TaxID=114890 RepID=A0AC35UF46_9BILA
MSSVQEIKQEISELRAVYRDQTKSFFCKLRKLKKKLCTAQLDAEETSHLDMMMQNGIYDEEDDGMEDKDDSDSVAGGFKIMNQITKDALTTKPGLEPGLPQAEKIRQCLPINGRNYNDKSNSDVLNILQEQFNNSITKTDANDKIQPESIVGLNLYESSSDILDPFEVCKYTLLDLHANGISKSDYAENILGCSEDVFNEILQFDDSKTAKRLNTKYYFIMQYFLSLTVDERISLALNNLNDSDFDCDQSRFGVLDHGLREVERSCKGRAQYFREQLENLRNKEGLTEAESKERDEEEQILRNEITKVEQIYTSQVQLYSDNIRFLQNKLHEDQTLNMNPSETKFCVPFEVDYSFNVQEVTDEQSAFLWKLIEDSITKNKITRAEFAENILGVHPTTFSRMLMAKKPWRLYKRRERHFRIIQGWLKLSDSERVRVAKEKHTK